MKCFLPRIYQSFVSRQFIHKSSIHSTKKRNDNNSSLIEYEKKRDFTKTTEPRMNKSLNEDEKLCFVIQEHHASILHFDFRLEHNGTLKRSVPKGPSLNPKHRRLAIMVEDHPISYLNFEGTIPNGEYGAGQIRIWDKGNYHPLEDFDLGFQRGKLTFFLWGGKLRGEFQLVNVRLRSNPEKRDRWLMTKKKDQYADEQFILKSILDVSS